MSSPLPLLQPEAREARSLSDQAYYRIRELIVSLELAPGSPVDERALMARLAIGRTPVREALRRLARDSLVEIHPRRGMFVSSVEVGDLAALSEVRQSARRRRSSLATSHRPFARRHTSMTTDISVCNRSRRPWPTRPA